jgi:phage terminase Nu1 subunit (DNA packaging protein)
MVTRLKRKGMPIDSVEAAQAWRLQNLRPRMTDAGRSWTAPRQRPRSTDAAIEADYRAERARRERAEADLAELKAAELAGSLVRAEDVRRRWSSIAGEVRAALLQLPARLAPVLAQRDITFIRQTLNAEIAASLEQMKSTSW